MRSWRNVMGKIEGKGKRGGWTERRGARKEGLTPGSEKGSNPDRQNGIHVGN